MPICKVSACTYLLMGGVTCRAQVRHMEAPKSGSSKIPPNNLSNCWSQIELHLLNFLHSELIPVQTCQDPVTSQWTDPANTPFLQVHASVKSVIRDDVIRQLDLMCTNQKELISFCRNWKERTTAWAGLRHNSWLLHRVYHYSSLRFQDLSLSHVSGDVDCVYI